jgi:hypothetical protein
VIRKLLGGLTAATLVLAVGASVASASPITDLDALSQSNTCQTTIGGMINLGHGENVEDTPAVTWDAAARQMRSCQVVLHKIPTYSQYSHIGWLMHMSEEEQAQAYEHYGAYTRTSNLTEIQTGNDFAEQGLQYQTQVNNELSALS